MNMRKRKVKGDEGLGLVVAAVLLSGTAALDWQGNGRAAKRNGVNFLLVSLPDLAASASGYRGDKTPGLCCIWRRPGGEGYLLVSANMRASRCTSLFPRPGAMRRGHPTHLRLSAAKPLQQVTA